MLLGFSSLISAKPGLTLKNTYTVSRWISTNKAVNNWEPWRVKRLKNIKNVARHCTDYLKKFVHIKEDRKIFVQEKNSYPPSPFFSWCLHVIFGYRPLLPISILCLFLDFSTVINIILICATQNSLLTFFIILRHSSTHLIHGMWLVFTLWTFCVKYIEDTCYVIV